ncbi:putative OVARIAN TUMOR DOMAIN-containing deubiquitinating enzyme 8 isoform X2 [Raphanus sativus]|uniref:OVARIAN TUMOR DOMAIN-containing deubiquitinating enzyme 8 isoform X2 n=1 Tax=Raphanus sativus TaxID=3726 RepID=A0A9W3DPC2_RAPSA|nr:putative OVARIAN TUMOR DOMAIN-containing deubiquitinating enzyme 8 isoform X2 [Raphanus sativus]
MFRALADQLYETSDFHKRVRQEIVNQLKSHPKLYKGSVGKMDFSEYLKNMSTESVWGDEVTLKAAADVYGVKILLITSFKDIPSIVVLPKSQKQPDKVIHLSYLAGIHFNSIHLNQGSSSSSHTLLQKKKNKNKDKDMENAKLKSKEDKKSQRKRTSRRGI